MADKDYAWEAQDDAADMAEEFVEQIVEQLLEKGKASDDYNNDYDGGDSYHHETHIDKSYSFKDACLILVELDEHEETDSGLWEGLDFKAAAQACAAYTYGNAVTHYWRKIIEEINGDSMVEEVLEIITSLEGMDDDDLEESGTEDEPVDAVDILRETLDGHYNGETTIEAGKEAMRVLLRKEVDRVIEEQKPS